MNNIVYMTCDVSISAKRSSGKLKWVVIVVGENRLYDGDRLLSTSYEQT